MPDTTTTTGQGNLTLTVLEDAVNIRATANITGSVIGVVKKGDILYSTRVVNDFYYIAKFNGYILRSTVSVEGTLTTPVVNTEVGLTDEAYYTTDSSGSSADDLLTYNLHGIHGMPYQFMSSVDRRLNGTDFGRKYAEKIVGRMPLLFLTPGKQEFMATYNKRDKTTILNALSDITSGSSVDIDGLLSKDGRYYTFSFEYVEYFKYVNAMANTVAKLLGIGDKKITIGSYTSKLSSFDWSQAQNSAFSSYFNAAENIVFYMDSNPSISESFSNETRESSLVATVNGLSDQAKELQFLVGGVGSDIGAAMAEDAEGVASSLQEAAENFANGGGVLANLTSGISTVLSGGKLVFPELWSDSDRSTSYDLSFKFRSPDSDDLSVYLNVIVPWIFLLAMTAPKRYDDNSYIAPFLVRAYYKGFFNVDMGIITSLSSEKGKEGAWNASGLPTEINVSMSIKDLYSSLAITSQSTPIDFVQNTALMDYLCNLAGVDLTKPEPIRQAAIAVMLQGGRMKNWPNKLFGQLEQSISNKLDKLF